MLLSKVDRDLEKLQWRVKVSYINPINSEQEKKRIFKENTYNPKLKYEKPRANLKKIEKQMLSLKTDKSIYGVLLRQKITEQLNLLWAIQNIGKRDFTKYSVKIYGKPNRELVSEAKRILKIDEEDVWTRYSKLTLTKKFMDHMAMKKVDWKVKEKRMVAGAAVNSKNKTLYINQNKDFSEADVKRLIVHEINTHAIRAENGHKMPLKLFKVGFPGYLETEEGLAAYNEYKAGLLSPKILRMYAGRVLAVHMSLKNSFSYVYNSLLEYFTKNDAWTLTLRAKRGLKDTSKPGAFTKDHLYLKGFLRVKQHAESGGDLKKLYVGKIGIEHVPLLKYIQNGI